jgi:hypothetical protein
MTGRREPVWVVASCGHERQVRITDGTNQKDLRAARMRVCSDCRYARFEIARAEKLRNLANLAEFENEGGTQ